MFGVSSDEYLSYAEANKAEWIEKGEAIVRDYEREAQAKFDEEGIILDHHPREQQPKNHLFPKNPIVGHSQPSFDLFEDEEPASGVERYENLVEC